jgi:TRAP-type C4-dicarboxylate transport system substrate-binding protein
MSTSTQEAVRIAGEKAGEQLRTKARLEVEEAVEAMKKRGLVVNKPNAEQMKEWNNLALSLYPKIRGTMVPAETFDEVFKHLNAYRSGKHK